METVHVLVRINQRQHARFVQMLRQRQLHQNAMNGRVPVQLAHRVLQLRLRAALVEPDDGGADARLDAGILLVAHVYLTGGILADKHHREVRRDAFPDQTGGLFCDFFLPVLRDGTSVDHHSAHTLVLLVHQPRSAAKRSAPSSATPTALSPESSGRA